MRCSCDFYVYGEKEMEFGFYSNDRKETGVGGCISQEESSGCFDVKA